MTLTGRIIKGIGGFYYVDAAGVLYETRARGIFRNKKITPLVGDIADIEITGSGTAFLTDIHERTSELVRPAVANVDQVLVIFAAANPVPSTGLLDRFLVNMEYQEIETVVVLSKVDLLDDSPEELMALETRYKMAGYRVIGLSNKRGEGLDEIRELLRSKTTVLSGPSGVGKSSLINNLVPGFEAETRDISKKLGKGKNTTRHSEIIPVDRGDESEDSYIIDTPGYSSIQLLVEDAPDIRYYIREFEGLNEQCKFAGCLHIAEPSCRVKEELGRGNISKERYRSYIDIYNEQNARRKW